MAKGQSGDSKRDEPAWSAREIARRNRESLGKTLSPVMKTAATACELAHGATAQGGEEARASAAPRPRTARSEWRKPAD